MSESTDPQHPTDALLRAVLALAPITSALDTLLRANPALLVQMLELLAVEHAEGRLSAEDFGAAKQLLLQKMSG